MERLPNEKRQYSKRKKREITLLQIRISKERYTSCAFVDMVERYKNN